MKTFKKYWKISVPVSRNSVTSVEYDHDPTDLDIQSFVNNEKVHGLIKIECFCKVINI